MKSKPLLNADLGEGTGNDKNLMPLIQACNIACGGHTGDAQEIQKTIALAKAYQVKIGAHPSYPDREFFGRRSLAIKPSELYESLLNQIKEILGPLAGEKLHHIKPHGALYHDCVNKTSCAQIFVDAVEKCCPDAIIITAPQSALGTLAEQKGYKVWREAFLDRAYEANGQLVSRLKDGAVLDTVEAIKNRLLNLTQRSGVYSIHGKWINLKADTYCVHGDHPNAAKLLKAVLENFNN